MTPERWAKIEEIFQAALDLPSAEREGFVARACSGDEELLGEVRTLIELHEEAGDFIEEPAASGREGAEVVASIGEGAPEGDANSIIGQRLGAYRVVRELGRGGMGAVYLAERADNEFERRVAIKIIKRGMDTDFVLRRFRHERQILASLEHPNISALLDGGATPDGLPYFVMEYIEGQPLYQYCDEQRLGVNERLRLFSQVCDAVDYAHGHKVIHRDIKPSNVLVNAAGAIKLFDFGIGKLLDPELATDTAPQTATAMRMMTVEYASPEQVLGMPVTYLSDIYSLGVLLYELLTGHRPYRFRSRQLHEMTRVIAEEEPEPPSAAVTRTDNLLSVAYVDQEALTIGHLCELRGGETPDSLRRELSGGLDRIILRALRKEPAERYQSAAALREDIARHLEGRPVSAQAVTGPRRKTATAAAAPRPREEQAIAILPLKILEARRDEDTGDDYLAVGLADALITRLGALSRFALRPTSSVLRYGGAEVDPLVAGRELDVGFVLDGRIRRAGERIRVTMQLLDVQAGAAVWGGQFDEKSADVLTIEDSISAQVAEALVPHLTRGERTRLARRGTDNAQAFKAYLRGRYHWHGMTEEGFAKAILNYRRAIELDPNYAVAYAGIADYYIFLGIHCVLPFAESAAAALAAAQRAVELDSSLAEAHSALAFATVCKDFDWETSEIHHRSALSLNPNYPTAHNWYGFFLMQRRRFDEAIAEVNRALEIDPISALSWHALAWYHYHRRGFDESVAVHRRMLESERDYAWGRVTFSWSLRRAGLFKEAVVQAERGLELAAGNPLYLAAIGAAYAEAGRGSDAVSVLEKIRETAAAGRYVSPYMVALIHCCLGENERALELLGEAVSIGDAWTCWLSTEPQLDPLRGDPRFVELLRRTGNPIVRAGGD